jgi:putative membrane protein
MGGYWKNLAWIWVWRHVRLGLAPRPLGVGAGRLGIGWTLPIVNAKRAMKDYYHLTMSNVEESRADTCREPPVANAISAGTELIDDSAPRSYGSPTIAAARARGGGHVIPASLIVAGLFGFLLVVFLIVGSGASEVARAMLVLGWWLAPITLFHLVPLFFDAVSWRELIPASSRPSVLSVAWIRWIRESISTLLPVAGVGGDVAAARLAHQQGVPGVQAAASMVVDITVAAVTQIVFVIAGAALLAARSGDRAAVAATLIGVGVFAAAIAAFVLVQHRNMFVALARLARRVTPEKWLSGLASSASAIDDAVAAAYHRRFALLLSNLLRLVGLVAGAGEIWLVMYFLMRPFSVADAVILESLTSGVRAAAFMVPGALGAFEGGVVVFGALFGLPADISLAISLAKRVRELALGLPGLAAWQWVEGHHLLRRGARP